MWGSHAVADGVSRGRDMTFGADVSPAMEFVVAPSMTMKAGCPVVYMRVREGFIVLGQSEVR